LRTQLKLDSPAVFNALVTDLCQNHFVRSGSIIAKGSHSAELPPELKVAAEKIRAALAAKPFDPPARASIVGKNEAALRFLIDTGEIIEVAPGVVLLRDSVEKMQAQVVDFLSKNGSATVSQLRGALQSSRRVMVPFLEYLDRSGVTKRAGDLRTLRDASAVARS
jgi:selenocysteine-specific elongation factor